MAKWLKAITLTLCLLLGLPIALAACSDDNQADVYVPTAYTDPTTGAQCMPWVNNPNEPRVMGVDNIPACRLPIPTERPVRDSGMSDADWLLLGGLFGFGMGHHSMYFGPSYYDMAIGPAWSRYPGSYYGYGHQPITHIDNRTYNTTITNVNTKYSADQRVAERDPKLSSYRDTKTGKSYTGATVPQKAFTSSNVPTKSGGNAGTVGGSSSSNTNKGGYKPSTSGGSSGKGGYSPSSGGSRGGSSGGGRK